MRKKPVSSLLTTSTAAAPAACALAACALVVELGFADV